MSKKRVFVRGILKLLLENKLISDEDSLLLGDAFSTRVKESFDYFLLSEGIVQKSDLLKVLSQYFNVPSFDASGHFFDSKLLHLFPKHFLVRNAIVPIERDENMLIVAASDPSNEELLPKIGDHVSYDIRFKVGLYQTIIDSVREYYDESLAKRQQ